MLERGHVDWRSYDVLYMIVIQQSMSDGFDELPVEQSAERRGERMMELATKVVQS